MGFLESILERTDTVGEDSDLVVECLGICQYEAARLNVRPRGAESISLPVALARGE